MLFLFCLGSQTRVANARGGDAYMVSSGKTMNKNTNQKINVSDEGLVRIPASPENATGAWWDVVVSSKYKCEKCGESVVSLVYWDGYIEYLEYPLLCRHCDGPREFINAVKTIAEKVKDQDEFYQLTEKLLSFARKEVNEE